MSNSDQTQPAFRRTNLQDAPSPVDGWRIRQTLVEIPERVSSGRHSHPGPEVGYIIRGDVSMEFDDDRPALELHAGSPFLIPPGVIHNAVNVGTVTTMMLSTYFIDEREPLVTNYPGGCRVMSFLDLSRWQFAFTVMFHMTFPALTVGMAIFLTAVYGVYWRTGREIYLQIFRFWKRIFAVGFALGVVAGTVMTFQFGLNWGGFASKTGPIVAPIIGMEVVTAFLVEAGFIGIVLYGDGRVKKRTMFVATGVVALGTVLSTTWILAANSWLQTPRGFTIRDGQFVPTDWAAAIFTPAFAWRFPHMFVGVLLSASLFIAGISAYYLLKNRTPAFAKRSFSIAIGALAVLIPFQLALGDHVAADVVGAYQPSKLQALEGNWTSDNTGYNIFVLPDAAQQRNLVEISIPLLGSFIAGDLSGNTPTPGLSETPQADQPNMWTVFWGFRVMFYSSMLIFAAAMIGVILRIRRRLFDTAWYLRFVMWLTPVGVIAILGGWVTAETGRQPWVVFGQLRTSDAVSNLAPVEVLLSVVGFMVLYLALLGIFIGYVVRTVRRGAERDDPALDEPSNSPDLDGASEEAWEGLA